MPKRDPHIHAHLERVGFVRPTGLVASAPALVRAGAILPRDPEGQRRLRACVAERRFHPDREPAPWLPDFRARLVGVRLGRQCVVAALSAAVLIAQPSQCYGLVSGFCEGSRSATATNID